MTSRRTRQIATSPTLRISGLAAELRAGGEDILDFAAGQPDFSTPEPVKQAGIRAIEANHTGYTVNPGLVELRQAISRSLQRDLGVDYAADQILVSPGAKASLYFAVMALLDPGDEVLVPAPYWVSYPEQIRLADAIPRFVDCASSTGFKLDPLALQDAIGPQTKAVMLNYPSNPTGACYDGDELAQLARVCVERGLWILADEIYSKLLYDGRRFASVVQVGPEVRERTVLINGMSKSYSMTGWRIGYTASTREVIAAMAKLQSHVTSNATSISQWASVEAFDTPEEELSRRVAEFQRRRDVICCGLNQIPGVSCLVPDGSFYAFPDVSGLLEAGGFDDSVALAEHLLVKAKVAVVPGEAFGCPAHLRLSYAVSLQRVEEGLRRIRASLGY